MSSGANTPSGSLPRWTSDLGVDVGTAYTRICGRDGALLLEEPSTLARDRRTGQVIAVGRPAEAMRGRAPHYIEVIRPLRRGTVADFFSARQLLAGFIHRMSGWRPVYRPRVVLGLPQEASMVEERALVEAARLAGAREIYLLPKPVAAVLGLGLEAESATGRLVLDLGGGSSEIGVVALGRVVAGRRLPGGGELLDQAIRSFLRSHHHLEVGEKEAESLKLALGNAGQPESGPGGRARGVDLVNGLPRSIILQAPEVQQVLAGPLEDLAHAVRGVLEKTPPQLVTDIAENGLYLTGGGSLLPGIDHFLSRRLGLAVHLYPQPQLAVAKGLGLALERRTHSRLLAVRRG